MPTYSSHNFTRDCLKENRVPSVFGHIVRPLYEAKPYLSFQYLKHSVIIIIFSVFALLPQSACAQGCSDASTNYLCAEQPAVLDSLSAIPFSNGCFNTTLTYFYTFHTAFDNTGVAGPVDINISAQDCDSFLGSDSIFVTVISISGGDPCNPQGLQYNCYGDTGSFASTFNGLPDDQDFVLVVGSNHNTAFGVCSFEVGINGPGVDVTASVDPFIITLGEHAQLSSEGGSASATYNWTPSDYLDSNSTQNPLSTPEQTTTYTVNTQIGLCNVSDQITVTVGPPIVVYTAFTPNSDGFNDVWNIKGIEKFENVVVTIFDRWGQQVFKSIGYAQAWDGTYRGRYLPTGAYYYVIELNSLDVNIPPITGEVSIIH